MIPQGFPDFAFILNMLVALGPFYVSLIIMGFLVKRKLDSILGPVQTNPLVKNVLGPIMAWSERLRVKEKMTDLGKKGVAARQFEAVMSEEQGLVVPLVGEALKSWVKERFGSKAEAKIAAAIDMVPFNADPVIFANLPQIAERLGGLVGKGVEAKALAEELKMLTKVQEPVK